MFAGGDLGDLVFQDKIKNLNTEDTEDTKEYKTFVLALLAVLVG